MAEATMENGVPQTAGWFVVNARDAPWMDDDMRAVCKFGGEGAAHFDDLGIGLPWLQPGKPMAMYHHEAGQEDFLVLRGRALLFVEGAERPLQTWDLVHCPDRTPHTIVAAGDEPALILAVGARKVKGSVRYPVDETARRHGAGVEHETASPPEAYARFGAARRGADRRRRCSEATAPQLRRGTTATGVTGAHRSLIHEYRESVTTDGETAARCGAPAQAGPCGTASIPCRAGGTATRPVRRSVSRSVPPAARDVAR
jgi:uncharacterized cupin superfamily protein